MELLSRVGMIVALVAGAFGIVESVFHVLPRKSNPKRLFEEEFEVWRASKHTHTMEYDKHSRVISYIVDTPLDEERAAFALASAVQHGDKSLRMLIEKNVMNQRAIRCMFDFLSGRGVRVGWRAEYVLTQLDWSLVLARMEELEGDPEVRAVLGRLLDRIRSNSVVDYIKKQHESGDSLRVRTYAAEVLTQVGMGRLVSEAERE